MSEFIEKMRVLTDQLSLAVGTCDELRRIADPLQQYIIENLTECIESCRVDASTLTDAMVRVRRMSKAKCDAPSFDVLYTNVPKKVIS